MSIKFPCEHCGKQVEAPDAAGGKRGKCPYCKGSNYIPAPVADDDLYALTPEADSAPNAEDAAVREQKLALLAEAGDSDDTTPPLEHREDVTAEDVRHLVVNYCLDIAASKLERAEAHVAELRKAPGPAREAIAALASGQVLEPALDSIPAPVLQGFLKQLKAAL